MRNWYILWFPSSIKKAALRSLVKDLAKFDNDSRVWTPTGFIKKKGVVSLRPIFSGYLFMHCRLATGVADYIQDRYKAYFLSGGKGPYALSEQEMESLKKIERNYVLEEIEELVDFELNDSVEIIEGPFMGLKGVVEEIRGEHIFVTASIFSRVISIPFDASFLRKE